MKRQIEIGLAAIAAICVVFLAAGCGSSRSGSSKSNGGLGQTVTGRVLAPKGVSLGMDADQLAEGGAVDPTGLEGKSGLSIEAYVSDKYGDKFGDTLGTATTGASGTFGIELSDSVKPSAALVLAVGNATETLHAIITGASVDVSPVSEYVYDGVLQDERPMEQIPISEISGRLTEAARAAERVDFSTAQSVREALYMLHQEVKNLFGAGNGINEEMQLINMKACRGCDLRYASLPSKNLSGADLIGANLTQAYLAYSNLSGANLSGANLSGANLSWTNLSGVNITGANLSGATWTDGHKCLSGSIGICTWH